MLKGNQKKLDLNKNKKIDKGDFKLLAKKKKKKKNGTSKKSTLA
jgi:hypothetical protein|tara:strand:+ start:239 stop:370 length:132 start_codon:yes stop_codon:yes gene_type:complete